MRLAWFGEGMKVFGCIWLAGFLFFDEEPLFDLTDWNGLHILLLGLSVGVVVWENTTRARYGQLVHKDTVLLFGAFNFYLFLEFYFRIIIVVFCLHCLTPFEAELLELASVFQSLASWITGALLAPVCITAVCLHIAYLLSSGHRWAFHSQVVALVVLLIVCLTTTLVLVAWDLLFSGLSAQIAQDLRLSFYDQPRTALTYDSLRDLNDQFDWHREQARPFVMRFEDLYVFMLQVFNLVTIVVSLLVWLHLLFDLLQIRGGETVSYTYFSVALRSTEHVAVSFLMAHFSLFYVGLRISASTPVDWWF